MLTQAPIALLLSKTAISEVEEIGHKLRAAKAHGTRLRALPAGR